MLPKPLARRIDRAARAAHAFHRYAHHPLCDEYRSEVVQLGRRTRLCRGCLLVATGTVAGLLAGGWLSVSTPVLLSIGVLAIGTSGIPWWTGRPGKWRTRFLPAAALSAVFAQGLLARTLSGVAWAAVAVVLYAGVAVAYRRRGPDRAPCKTCPEWNGSTPCRGIRPVVRRERAFQRLTGRMIARAGF